ncbi:hypothetical protein A3H09_02735 [Candidatus Falkowbacteria bacterium RIFCSPLOWO2_12_FULL_45_13]|uniref:Uncharacterized protein n=2 Tax=Candidatus Falkowiibacteriota TaxID=1752728 RepID=A0A1F5SC77_9BACT|nr:MAG: hypothetical protein A3H66_02075 [Candidatus Falkowbacteria bacterium RIFCSPLOWO2_02_FULL_45_21]OGF29865.1 MAG: hypothetical protein A3H09_02735 [Candidatus Falkowbacteria bacterium RIFCSPLOWO2_12_FULL_45_13]
MTKRTGVLIFFLAVFLLLFFYLILTSGSLKEVGQSVRMAEKEKIAMPEEEYKAGVKAILSSYEKLVLDNKLTIKKIEELRNALLEMKGFQAKFRTMHLNFVLTLDRMENYLIGKKEQEKNASQQMANQLKADYSWLNN